MNWLRRRHSDVNAPVAPLDLEELLKQGLRDAPSARNAIADLKREQRDLERQRKVVDRQLNRLTSGKVRRIAWSNSANPQVETYMLADAMREADAAQQMDRTNQLAEIDNRLQALARAKLVLDRLLKRHG